MSLAFRAPFTPDKTADVALRPFIAFIAPIPAFTPNPANIAINNYKKAINNFNKAIRINPNVPTIYYNLGIAKRYKGDIHEAINSYKKAISINQNHTKAYNNLGNLFRDQGNLEDNTRFIIERAWDMAPKIDRHSRVYDILAYWGRKCKQRGHKTASTLDAAR